MVSTLLDSLKPRHLGLVGMVALAWAFMSLFRYDNYGIEEAAAIDLLINWSIIHQIASPVALFGVPDLRAIFFVPLDLYWAGSLAAAKVYTLFTLLGTALLLYRWGERQFGGESSMMATALLLIAPITLMQTDAIGAGIFMLFCFAVAGWLNEAIHESGTLMPSWYFLLILITGMAVSMHPMGLAIPLVLGWQWLRDSEQKKKGMRLMIGIAIVTVLMVFVRWGWNGMDAAVANPLTALADAILGSPLLHEPSWGIGLIIADVLLIAIGMHLYRKNTDSLSLIFIAASLIGSLHADHAWALIAWATTLFLGLPLLIEINERLGWRGLAGQRGLLLLVIVLIATISMLNTRALGVIGKQHLKNDTDTVISVLEREAADPDKAFVAASQWPARTLLATKRDVLPLPPALEDTAMFKRNIAGVTHFAFNPQLPSMHALARNAAALSDELETIALLPGGVVLKARGTLKKEE
ncbi:MAG: hypothetical protein R8L58_05300 [Mariprofundaceae bacterium]